MKSHLGYFIFLLSLLFLPQIVDGQNIFSEKNFDHSKSFLPYDISYTFPLEDKEFVMLSEVKRSTMKFGRYDQYFFEKWEKEIEFGKDESVPQMFIKGDSVVTFCVTTNKDKNELRLSFRYFNLQDGTEYSPTNYAINVIVKDELIPQISFCENRSKFVVYNYLVNQDNTEKYEFSIFEMGNEKPEHQNYLSSESIISSKSRTVHLSDNGDLFLVLVEPGDFHTETYFWGIKSSQPASVDNNFFFERPVQNIGETIIVRQSPSSYMIAFSGLIEDELIGFNITGINVVLKTVMFSYNQNFRKEEIDEIYGNYYYTSQNQKKKRLETPEILVNYRLIDSYTNSAHDIILAFEELEIPVQYHETAVSENMPWKYKSNEDKFYFAGDLLLYSFTESGELKWRKSIQKTQFSQANALGLSYIPKMSGDTLRMLMYESSRDGNFYILDINTVDGILRKTINLLPDEKFEFAKRYSCWLDDHAVILCGIAPANINKRTLMLVEF